MNKRQIERTKVLIDVIATKIKINQDIRAASYCYSSHICGTAGCVWGDFVAARGGLAMKALEKELKQRGYVQTFEDFSSYVHNQTLKNLSLLLANSFTGSGKFLAYFGLEIDVDLVFGEASDGEWETRYKHVVLKLWDKGHPYDPLELYES